MNSQMAPTLPGASSTAKVSASVGGIGVGSINHLGWSDVSAHWWPTPINNYHYTTVDTTLRLRPNPTETAFKIVARMMEDGLVGELTVKQFVKLVDDVATIVKES